MRHKDVKRMIKFLTDQNKRLVEQLAEKDELIDELYNILEKPNDTDTETND